MYPFSIGVMLDSFRTDVNTALDKAPGHGGQGVQVPGHLGGDHPSRPHPGKAPELLKAIKDRGLTVSALCGDLGQGFVNPQKNPALIEESKRILELAKDLETDVVTTHIGVVPRINPTPATPLCRRPAAAGRLRRFPPGPLRH